MPKTAIDLLLASNSPRRKDLLTQMGVNFSVIANSVDESLHSAETPRDYVSRLALAKARGGICAEFVKHTRAGSRYRGDFGATDFWQAERCR